MELYDCEGKRLYLNTAEREAFRLEAEKSSRDVFTFCLTLFYTGCRISEALELTPERIDFKNQSITIRSLKKRSDKPKYRAVPVPSELLKNLNLVHGIQDGATQKKQALWSWSRTTAWRRVCEVMGKAGLEGIHASPKGLRHSYGVNAVVKHVPLNKLRDWMGHADMKTTAIYANALGEEEQAIASRMWE